MNKEKGRPNSFSKSFKSKNEEKGKPVIENKNQNKLYTRPNITNGDSYNIFSNGDLSNNKTEKRELKDNNNQGRFAKARKQKKKFNSNTEKNNYKEEEGYFKKKSKFANVDNCIEHQNKFKNRAEDRNGETTINGQDDDDKPFKVENYEFDKTTMKYLKNPQKFYSLRIEKKQELIKNAPKKIAQELYKMDFKGKFLKVINKRFRNNLEELRKFKIPFKVDSKTGEIYYNCSHYKILNSLNFHSLCKACEINCIDAKRDSKKPIKAKITKIIKILAKREKEDKTEYEKNFNFTWVS